MPHGPEDGGVEAYDVVASVEADMAMAEIEVDQLDGVPITEGPFNFPKRQTNKGLSDEKLIARPNSPVWERAATEAGRIVLDSPSTLYL